MANAAGMLKESIWRDKEFRALPRTAQATYAQLLSQKELDRAGIQPLQVSKWAKGCDETVEADIWDDLKLLEAHRFVFVDEDSDELFIRSYMRHSEVVRYPNILKNALRCATLVASEKLRHEIAQELRRLRRDDAERVANQIDVETPTNPSQTVLEPFGNRSAELNGSGTVPEPQGVGEGVGEGSSNAVGHLGGARASTTVATQQPESGDGPPPLFCPRHMPDGTDDPCGACRRYRERREAYDAELDRRGDADRRRIIAERRACQLCDDNGIRDLGERVIRCTHQPIEVPNHV